MLSPVVVTPYLPTWVDSAAQLQLIYGGAIVTFLGAVHWGAAMSAGIRKCPHDRGRYTAHTLTLSAFAALLQHGALPALPCLPTDIH